MITPSREEAPERVLLPCPFCGMQPTINSRGNIFTFLCPPASTCIGSGMSVYGLSASRERAIAQWNTRADLANREPSEGDVASEREACAAIADSIANMPLIGLTHGVWDRAEHATALRIAKLIRARKTP